MIKFNNRILMMTTMLLTFSFMTTANAQTLISGESGGGESTTTTQTCEMPPSCESLGYNKTAEDCANKVTLKCPMDESKLYCADAKQNGVCSLGYSEIEKIIPYCTGDNARLVYDTLNPNCAKCQKCSGSSHLSPVSGCCPDLKYNESVDGCTGSKDLYGVQKYSTQDANGCWTCSKCRSQYTLNADGLCVDPSVIGGTGASKIYKVGDTYVDSNGIGIGKVVQITGDGRHGLIAISGGSGTLEYAQTTCNNKNAGGLDWALGGGEAICGIYGNNYSKKFHGDATTACFQYSDYRCRSDQNCAFVCEARF